MGIYQRQFNKLLAQEILRYLLMGRVPDINQVVARVRLKAGKDSNITYQFSAQPSRDIFQNQTYNKSLRRIKFDIDTLHEEVLDLINTASERMSYADLFHKVNSYELSNLESKLKSLLFTMQNADFYFLGAFENFNDTTKLDKEESTESVIDLSEGCLELPYGGKNTQKIKSTHLYNVVSWPIQIISPDPSHIVSSSPVPGTSFGSMFSDTISAWAHEIITDTPVEVTARIEFPLAGSSKEEIEVLINRIEMLSHTSSPQRVKVKVSNDSVNFISPLGYEEGLEMSNQKLTYAMDFETNLVQYVQLSFSKLSPDKEIIEGNTKKYQYIFGLRNFSSFTVGRVSKARYQSLPFDFTDEEEKISKVSIESLSEKPRGCSITYSIALADEEDKIVSSFVPITPLNQTDGSIGTSQVVQFNTTLSNSIGLTIPSSGDDSPQVYGRPFQGRTFYRIGPVLDPIPVFGSSRLYRGFKSWYRDLTQSFELIKVSDIFVSFEQNDSESVYALTKESAPGVAAPNRGVRVTVSNPVYYNSSRGHLMKPPPSVTNPSIDTRPNYAVYKVSLTGPTVRRTVNFLFAGAYAQVLPVTSFKVVGAPSDLPVLKTTTGHIFVLGTDYTIDIESIGGRTVPTGLISFVVGGAFIDPQGTVINQGLLLQFSYINEPDITYKVSSITNNEIILSNLITSYDDNIEVTYRYVPVTPNKIIKSTLKVYDLPSSAPTRITYVEGTDYVINVSDGGIQRIPTGRIVGAGVVYVDFTFRDSTIGVETFMTWCNITDTSGVQIRFEVDSITKKNKLVADSEKGESFYVNSSQGLINLTNAITTPILGPGWVQFVVRSKNPLSNQTFRTNLINQVIQLRDENNKKVFRDNNLYFKEIVCIRDSLKESTLNHLKVNTLKSDHSVFAIDTTTSITSPYLVLNFLPNTTSELYLYGPTADTDASSNPVVISEEFLYQWESKLESTNAGSKVVVRIDLERSQDSDGSLTPKVFDYKLRASV